MSKTVASVIENALADWLEAKARDEDRTVSQVIRRILDAERGRTLTCQERESSHGRAATFSPRT